MGGPLTDCAFPLHISCFFLECFLLLRFSFFLFFWSSKPSCQYTTLINLKRCSEWGDAEWSRLFRLGQWAGGVLPTFRSNTFKPERHRTIWKPPVGAAKGCGWSEVGEKRPKNGKQCYLSLSQKRGRKVSERCVREAVSPGGQATWKTWQPMEPRNAVS